jgi:Na+/H+ antiporter NhaD/arsenite permease-like protein
MTPFLWAAPFVILLLSIAFLPLAFPARWDRLSFKGLVAGVISAPVLWRLLTGPPEPLRHITHEYTAFVLLLGSLYVVASGISVVGDVEATPRTNTGLLLIGGVLASFIGTTGASMLMLPLVLAVNSERKIVTHTVVFFVFVVANSGGLLTPLGDPPLFLGFLEGVPFFWTLKLWPVWLTALVYLLTVYYFLDRRLHGREAVQDLQRDKTTIRPMKLTGAWNVLFLAGIVFASAQLPTGAREGAYIGMALGSLGMRKLSKSGGPGISWHPILEVAILFAGIFISMEPALAILRERAPQLGLEKPWQFFWASGSLSSFLDNAPTYAAFLALARGLGRGGVAGVPEPILAAISCGSVLFGAMTYIGNGPNFLVMSMAEASGVKMPSFFGYMLWSVLTLVPLFVLLTFVRFAP